MQKQKASMNWDDLRFFTALAECKTVTAAANRLGVNYVTVSRRIDRLEDALRQTLFERLIDGYHLTVEGDMLYQKVSPIQESIEQVPQVFDPALRYKRSVKLSMVPSLAEYLVTPHLVRLQKRYPELRLDLDVTTRNVSIVRREADIALRLDLPESGESIARKLGELNYQLCGTPEWVSRYKAGENVPTISYGSHLSHLPESKYILARFGNQSVRFQTNAATVQKKAAESGYGLALLPDYLVADSLLQTIELEDPVRREIWMLVRKNISQLASVRLVMEALVALFESK
jgi:DNA-binding transcriptional LysR family regulator